ncbi:NAD(P)/FAD-dependent oxidoreductase [Alcaligenaceae bacterium]|nr:NAD(P)/FAD-dependent oxidoreductase [Alcaligenaceae bacterium]
MKIDDLPVCIIGAGSSGLATAKSLKERGVAFDCFEIGSDIGGMWRYENDNGLSSAYRSLHIDTSRDNLGYSDFPIPSTYPDFLSHAQVIEYFEAYVAHFDLRRHIQFNTRVEKVERNAQDNSWTVYLASGASHRYRAVIAANGHLWDPRWPDFPGTFDGEAIHSHHYRTAEPFLGKNVLVVGIGNSAVDVAVDVCKQAQSTTLSTRRSAWIMPKYIMAHLPGLYAVGLVQPIGPTIPLVEIQAQWLGEVLAGKMSLPARDRMEEEVDRHYRQLQKRYVGSARYTLEVDFREYAGQLRADMRAGQAGV